MKILLAASEVLPFAKTGGLADVTGALPLALEKAGHEIIVTMPRYKTITDTKFKIQRLKEDISYSIIGKNIKVYFIENSLYFNRDGLYGDKSGDFKDNLERFSYYCRRSLELLKEVSFSRPTITTAGGIQPLAERPDIIHLHDWQAALIAVYLKSLYVKDNFYKNIRTALTIHNIGYQGIFPKEEFPKLGLDWSLFNIEGLEFYNQINILKGGIEFGDIINTVSPTYSKEIQTKEFGFGLDGVLNKRRDMLFGILNGLDYSIWNPQEDKFIAANYSLRSIKLKDSNKTDLQGLCKLPKKLNIPLFGVVSRLAQQKGFDILVEAIDTLAKMDLQLVILGTGDQRYHLVLEAMAKKYPKVISLNLKFDDSLAHKIYAGADIFLMPSRYEPCGLGQMISLKYGTLPLVFRTGGLADTVNENNGFVFDAYTKEALIKAIKESITAFKDKKKWLSLRASAMQCNFSWQESAKEYLRLYAQARQR